MVGFFIIYTGRIGAPIVWYSTVRRHDGLPSSWRHVKTASLQADSASQWPPSSWQHISSWQRIKTASLQADSVSRRPRSSWWCIVTASFKLTAHHDGLPSSWQCVMTPTIQADGASWQPSFKLTARRDGLPSIWRHIMMAFLQVDVPSASTTCDFLPDYPDHVNYIMNYIYIFKLPCSVYKKLSHPQGPTQKGPWGQRDEDGISIYADCWQQTPSGG